VNHYFMRPVALFLSCALQLITSPAILPTAAAPCAACAAVTNELERQMHEEWGHLQLTVRDRKRKLAQDAVREHACSEAISEILKGICKTVDDYAVAQGSNGEVYYQKLNRAEENSIVIKSGVSLSIQGHRGNGLGLYCKQLMASHEDRLAEIMAFGTDDLIRDFCIDAARECTATDVQRIPSEGLPRYAWGS
jgi:hypothetical protein